MASVIKKKIFLKANDIDKTLETLREKRQRHNLSTIILKTKANFQIE